MPSSRLAPCRSTEPKPLTDPRFTPPIGGVRRFWRPLFEAMVGADTEPTTPHHHQDSSCQLTPPSPCWAGLTSAEFLRDVWQQQPLLIRGAFPDFDNPLSPDELAGLACEDNIEARLVEEQGPDGPWQVSHGPFDETTFARLPERDWTLLVQAVDHYVPEVAALLENFTFLPRWRLDDIMVSYAPPGGSVGPHLDQYDVFLLQGCGQRRWQLGGQVADDAPILRGIDLRILETFEVNADQDWVLEPGRHALPAPRLGAPRGQPER